MTTFNFSEVVIVEGNLVGVVVKCWADDTHEVYVRSWNRIATYPAAYIRRFIYDKELPETDE